MQDTSKTVFKDNQTTHFSRTFVLWLALICQVGFSFGQTNTEIDSLKSVVSSSSTTKDKAAAYSRLSWLHILQDVEKSIAYNDTAFTLYKELDDKIGLANTNYKYGVIERFRGNYTRAIDHMDESLKFYEKEKDTLWMANTLFQVGVIYSLLGDNEKSLKTFYSAVSNYESLGMTQHLGTVYNSIGIVQNDTGKFDDAIKSYKKAISINEQFNDSVNLPNALSNLAVVYLAQDRLDDALEYFEKARWIDLKTNNLWGLSKNSQNVGTVLIEQKKYAEAKRHLLEAYEIQKKNGYSTDIVETLTKLGIAHMELGDFKQSESYFLEALNINSDSKRANQELNQFLAQLYKRTDRPQKALFYFEQAAAYKDSILNQENQEQINLLQSRFESERKDKEIAQQELSLAQQNSELKKKRNQNNFLIGMVLLLVFMASFIWIWAQQRQKDKKQEILALKREHQISALEALIKGEEKERARIAQELHDGVNSELSAIKYKLSSALDHNQKTIAEAITLIDHSCQQVRAISHNLIPPSIENFDLLEAVRQYCETMNDSHTPEITFQHIGNPIAVSKQVETNIYRIIQELVLNAIKHADAKNIDVQIGYGEDQIQVSVEDDGKGYDQNSPNSDGIGLNNIESRIGFLQGEKDVISNERGTSVTVAIDTKKLK